jgi:protein gp37
MSKRLQAMGQSNYRDGFNLSLHENALDIPLHWKKPQLIFVNSMSDLFHENVPVDFISKVFDTMRQASWHTFQILTKRSSRLLEMDNQILWPKNVWMGVSVENNDYTFRIDHLQQTHAFTKFLSLEPLLGPLPHLRLEEIDWVIVGGESGPGSRKMDLQWVQDIRDQCQLLNTPFFFKQWGGVNRKKTGRSLDGRTWDELPTTKPIKTEQLFIQNK